MSDTRALLEQASGVLAGGGEHSNRMACWIARSALESCVDDLLLARQRAAESASMRSRLSVLQVAYEQQPEVAQRAEYAWSRLSRACHHHAYELSPTATGAEHLIGVVDSLAAHT